MDLPATYYGKLDKRNPVISTFKRDINSFVALMRQVASSTEHDNSSYAKGIKILVEIWKKYKHRLPPKLYQEHMLQIADFLFEIKLYQLALWQGYSLHLLQFSSVKITEITDVDRFMACFFPEGFDTDQDTFTMKVLAMQGCALCLFELEKKHDILSEKGLWKLLRVLNFIRIMMQAFQQHEHLYWQIYKGASHIYTICRFLMMKKCSAQALEYLLWASISLELSIPLMTAKYLPLIITLYCAVCHCYYDNRAEVQAEEFARRALGKINELAKLEEQSEVPTTRETQRAYKEASVKLGAMVFKRAVFDGRRRPKVMFRTKPKNTLKDIPNVPWPRTPTERILQGLFDSKAGQFFGILEALWDSTTRTLQTRTADDAEQQEVFLELLSAGISILSGSTDSGDQCMSPVVLMSTSTLLDLAVMGENKVPIVSAVRFIKLLFQHKQQDAFTELAQEMQQVLSGVEGQSFRKAEQELTLLDSFNILLSSQRSHPREDNRKDDRPKSSFSMSDELIALVDILHKSVCGSALEVQPDGDLVLDIVLFVWGKVKVVRQKDKLQTPEFTHHREKWAWCLSKLCEVAFACDLATVDCIITAEMTHTIGTLLENADDQFNQAKCQDCAVDDMKLSSLSPLESSSTELLQKVCDVVRKGLEALAKGSATLMPHDSSAVVDSAFMQKFSVINASAPSPEAGNEEDTMNMKEKEEIEAKTESNFEGCRQTQPTRMFLLVKDLYLELDIIYHKTSLKLLQLNAVTESELLNRIKKNKVSKVLFLVQKALLEFNNMELNDSCKTKSLLEEASTLLEKAGLEEKKLYMSTIPKTLAENAENGMKVEENPLPPPILLSRSDHSFTFAPAPYNLAEKVCWYQLCGRVAESLNWKVRLGDFSLPGTGKMVPAVCGECVLRVEGLEPNQKYVFAVAAYNCEGKLLGNTIGGTTLPLLASLPAPLLSAWAHLAQVAFQTEQYAIAKRACRELWSHYTYPDCRSQSTDDRFATIELRKQALHCSSSHLCQLFLISIFIETEINIQQGSLYCDSFSDNGPFIWEKEGRLAECERMLVAMDLTMCLNDGSGAVQAVVSCYGLLAPLIFHQISCDPVVQVLIKCLTVLEENSGLLKRKWSGNTSQAFVHMIACITYYLSKALRVLRKHEMAAVVMELGCKLLQEVYDAQQQICRLAIQTEGVRNSGKYKTVGQAAGKGEMKINIQLKALQGKNKTKDIPEVTLTTDNEVPTSLPGCKHPAMLYDLISSSTLDDAYEDVMKLKRMSYFTEFAALLLQRTMEEGHIDLVLNWGQSMFEVLSKRDKAIRQTTKYVEKTSQRKKRRTQAQKENETSQNKSEPSQDERRKKLKQTMPRSMLQRVRTNREMQVVENLLSKMSSVVQRQRRQLHLRGMCSGERVWKAHLNYLLAQAHLALLYRGLDQLCGGAVHRYSQFAPLFFSLAYSGVLLRRKLDPQQSSKPEVVLESTTLHSNVRDCVPNTHKGRNKKEAGRAEASATEESCEEGEGCPQTVEKHMETPKYTAEFLLESLNKAVLHLRRTMVLAHRGAHWATLQYVCQTVWDQNCRITLQLQTTDQPETPSPITTEQLHTIFTPLLVLATDLIMDMLNKLGLWSLYDSDLTEEELESSLHFSVPLDDNTQVDLRWIRTLVLYTLERLHDSGKWERLVHIALIFNSYTRERYSLTVTPLLVHAQRRLLERIGTLGGPAVPQPHHVKTLKATGKEVTFRSYAGCQLLSGWSRQSEQQQLPTFKKAALSNPKSQEMAALKGAEIQRSMSLVCVPLDVEDSLSCYRQALENRAHCLQFFQHSRSLVSLLLAHTQSCFVTQLQPCHSRDLSQSASLVDFRTFVIHTPNLQPCDLTEEDYSTPDAIYSLPIGPKHMQTVTASCSTCIKYIQANGHDSLRTLALHEMGNLQFYNGNTRAAHSCWSKAVDCALHSSGAVEKWDGISLEGGSMQQSLKQAGVWGCLQAAVLTAKIAQYILTSDISQRTKCCLLSVHLFKCVLCCSMPEPQSDLQYASYSIGDELLPGVDLFSEPNRVHLGSTVTSLNFVCHWLFTTGYCITLLPILALYLHVVGTVCRDVQRTAEGKILKMRVLTELCLFTEAIKEALQLTQGIGVLLPYGHYVSNASLKPLKTFYSNRSLLDNVEVLEELVNCDFAPEVCTLYGPTVCVRFNLARTQLVLALTKTVCSHPIPEEASTASCSVNSEHCEQNRLETEGSCLQTVKPTILSLDIGKEKLTQERIKLLLLEGSSSLLQSISQQLTSQSCSEMENLELTIEFNLLKANLYLQQGHAALSSEMAVSSLVLLQTSPVLVRGSSEQDVKDTSVSNTQHGDDPKAVEARERIGVSMWLRCRFALVRSLVADVPGTAALFPGKNMNEEVAQLLQEGLDECVIWGDHNTQALLLVEGAQLEALRGKTDDSMAMLQEAVNLLSGQTRMPPGSVVTLAQATLLLSDLKGPQSTTLLQLTQKLLIKQLRIFGQSVVLVDRKLCFSPPGPSNIYLPYLNILNQTTLQTDTAGCTLDLGTMERPISIQSSQSTSRQNLHQFSQTEGDSQAVTCQNNPSTSSPERHS